MKKKYIEPSLKKVEIKTQNLLINMSDNTPADPSVPVEGKESIFEDIDNPELF